MKSTSNIIPFLIAVVFVTLFISGGVSKAEFNPFASRVIDISLNAPDAPTYLPAPGQRVNIPPFKYASNALGTLSGGGTSTANNDNIVTLGGFGGKIVLAFEQDVEDNPANPMGLDAIVFSNTMWVWNFEQYHFSEPGTIEIMPELNDTNIPGDDPNEKWYLIAGSHLFDNQSLRTQTWSDSNPGYPVYTNWPASYETTAYELFPIYQTIGDRDGILVNPNYDDTNPNNDTEEGYWGYAEYTPSLKLGDRDADNNEQGYGDCSDMPEELFYTVPDDPMTVGITVGSCGGDAFDIRWAVDANTWEPANLSSFRYIRITTAVDERGLGEEGILGEISTEIDAVSDVRPVGDIDGDNDVDSVDLNLFTQSWLSEWSEQNFNPAADLVVDNKIDLLDYAAFAWGRGRFVSSGY